MIVRAARAAVFALAAATIGAACANPFTTQYEYEEQVYLSIDGRASVVIDTSFDALVALRGAAIDRAIASADRDGVRRLVTAAGCSVESVSRFWTRHGRRFVQIQVAADHVQQLPTCQLLAWSTYALDPIEGQKLRYVQEVGAPTPGATTTTAWSGDELVAFKVHLPSRIVDQNVKLLNGQNGSTERGNILTWAQTLADRRAGRPLSMRADMEDRSILHTTLWLFAGAFSAAVLMLVAIIWLVMRRGRRTNGALGL